MRLLVGLGNPGQKYEKHRHNVGFMAVDAVHRHESLSSWKPKFQALTAEGTIGGEKVLLIKPTTYMNDSGRAVAEAARFYKLEPADVIVLYDELDLAPGKVRIKTGGGAGGHNGIRSIDAHLGKDYSRVRIGIGHPGHKDRVTGHVLGDFAKADHEWLDPLLDEIGRNADLLVKGEDAAFMNKLALTTQSNEPSGARGQTSAKGKTGGGKSHIRQARQSGPKPKVPSSGPMADMLKKLFGDKS
ncbi:aminoacyl-tRNA hydrolase [Pseudahrensia aquimaris]|uniref:Peptidyl-tRNA hydrolase n=1 Tax=Pseudahrensia aquimaris TaxID=744461 RepID=A0ABW3FD58_9HYPH